MWRAQVVRSPYFRWTIRPISESCRASLWSRTFTASRWTRGPTACTRRRNKTRAGPHRGCSSSRPWPIKILPPLLAVLLIPASALAYRPFVSTDAAVADPREVEIEFGYFNLERTRRENRITTPSVVLNYGFAKNWEAVGEFRVETSPELEITDPGLSLKSVLKEGVLQGKEGVSFAIEAGLLLPSTRLREHGGSRYTAARCVSGKKAYTVLRAASKPIVCAPRSVGTLSRRRSVSVSKTSMTPGSPIAT